MGASRSRSGSRTAGLVVVGALTAVVGAGVGVMLIVLLIAAPSPDGGCGAASAANPAASIALGSPGQGARVGATEYGGPGDPSSGIVGASGANLVTHPDSFAELGGVTFQSATAMGGLPYMTPLRITWGGHSAIAYKRDFGLGGGPIAGLPRVIDLWWQLAGALGIPYDHGLWSGPVQVQRPRATGSGNLLLQTAGTVMGGAILGSGSVSSASASEATCAPSPAGGVALTPGPRATLMSDGRATAPASAPPPVN